MDALVLYVNDIEASVAFYKQILPCNYQRLSPTFASLDLEAGVTVQLKQHDEPKKTGTGGGAELSLLANNKAVVMQKYQEWQGQGVEMVHAPTELPYGLTFLAMDKDKHQIRIWSNIE